MAVVGRRLGLGVCLGLMCLGLMCWGLSPAVAAPESNIIMTKHNLSAQSGNEVRASSESQVCVFCHTPHGGDTSEVAPLWNRQLNNGTAYQVYASASLQSETVLAPGGASKLCLSCHDGTVALGAVNVANGRLNPTIAMSGTQSDGTMPAGSGEATGFTRRIGTNLTNDHPISFTFDTALALADGELRDPDTVDHIGPRAGGNYPQLPLDHDGKLQCSSCHDPHLFDPADPNRKFLRANRLQQSPPSGSDFEADDDMICLGCHDKEGEAWSLSVHASPASADYSYTDAAASQRQFPLGTKVWQAGCLNCHDTHTVEGSRRLLREGTDSTASPKSGGNPAIEETCYQCHRDSSNSVLSGAGVQDILSDFQKNYRMPITNTHQQRIASHDINNADFEESRELIGEGSLDNLKNRHVECTDCHNPHRVMKAPLFNAMAPTSQGTHNHSSSTMHSNIASGALKGSVGVEPMYYTDAFLPNPQDWYGAIGFIVKKGVPPAGGGTEVTQPYVTREYQVCLRCHSNYGFGSNPPTLGESGGGTPHNTNWVTQFTNQAMEFQAPSGHEGYNRSPAGWASNNSRSWHPVMQPTGRISGTRSANLWYAPWNTSSNLGRQTMYCSDCHGSETSSSGNSAPASGKPWGPHGSNNNFILRGSWTNLTSSFGTDAICFKCHTTSYRSDSGTGGSAFGGEKSSDLHSHHADKIRGSGSSRNNLRCTMCHVALPHGWKNKAFLVNLNDVGPEAGRAPGTAVSAPFTSGPYYQRAYLTISSWGTSGNWRASNCRGRGWMEDTCS